SMDKVKDLVERLNAIDECGNIEAKKASAIDRSIMETVCALSNESGLGGGYILLGVQRDENSLFPYYSVTGIENPDKVKLDFATQCANMFNMPVRPEIDTEQMANGKIAIKVFVPELAPAQKPLYFKNEGLPRGAYRRISSSDQRCTEDDLYIFYNREDSLDSSIIKGTSLDDVSEDAVDLYRKLRTNVNAYAEELSYNNTELLQALGCIKTENNQWLLTYTGLLVFGKRLSLRRLLPMVRVDYIRIPGNEWIKDPDNRFTTTDMRGPLIELVQRTFNSIADDLPKGFLLPEGQVQAESIGLPVKVLREAIVNAFIHRTYRENQPVQIIRYGNRIEIKNPGFSLKPEEQLGEPGSKNRNPFIAAIFHETNLAETKGSGIRIMRTLMEQASMVPPTFESDHSSNLFTTRLLLHHFLSEADIIWLRAFEYYNLNDGQKRALIFVREAGAIDNSTYRQINGCDILRASGELRSLRDGGLLEQKGKGRATYYIPGYNFTLLPSIEMGLNPLPDHPSSLPDHPSSLPDHPSSLSDQLPLPIQEMLASIGKRTTDKEKMKLLIIALCNWRSLSLKQLSQIIQRNEKYLLENFITPLREAGELEYTIPDMPNHPDQAYRAVKKLNT
ncbi:MAG: ATP-binding protein, partial [Bacteroidota bacterium]